MRRISRDAYVESGTLFWRVHESMAEDAFEGDSFVGGVGMLSGHKISDDSRTPEYGVRINASMKREGITGTVVLTQI